MINDNFELKERPASEEDNIVGDPYVITEEDLLTSRKEYWDILKKKDLGYCRDESLWWFYRHKNRHNKDRLAHGYNPVEGYQEFEPFFHCYDEEILSCPLCKESQIEEQKD